jgi:hypothetical protein
MNPPIAAMMNMVSDEAILAWPLVIPGCAEVLQ